MLIAERHRRIVQILQRHGKVEQGFLAKELDVSVDTVRRDLAVLAEEGKLIKVRGGAITAPGTVSSLSYSQRRTTHIEEKKLLCKAAADFICPGESIFICNSTTTLPIGEFLSGKGPLTAMVNGLSIAQELLGCTNVTTHLTGGQIRQDSGSMVGPATETTLSWYSFDKAFLTAGGIHPLRGIATNTPEMASLLRAAANQARETWYLVPAGRIGRVFFSFVSNVSAIDTLVTSSEADETYLDELRNQGVRIILADKEI